MVKWGQVWWQRSWCHFKGASGGCVEWCLAISAVWKWTPGLQQARFTVESEIACYKVEEQHLARKPFVIFFFFFPLCCVPRISLQRSAHIKRKFKLFWEQSKEYKSMAPKNCTNEGNSAIMYHLHKKMTVSDSCSSFKIEILPIYYSPWSQWRLWWYILIHITIFFSSTEVNNSV